MGREFSDTAICNKLNETQFTEGTWIQGSCSVSLWKEVIKHTLDCKPAVHTLYGMLKLSSPSVTGKLNLETLQHPTHCQFFEYTHAVWLSKQSHFN